MDIRAVRLEQRGCSGNLEPLRHGAYLKLRIDANDVVRVNEDVLGEKGAKSLFGNFDLVDPRCNRGDGVAAKLVRLHGPGVIGHSHGYFDARARNSCASPV